MGIRPVGTEQPSTERAGRRALNRVNVTELARQLSIPRGTVSRVWAECQAGKHPRPMAPVTDRPPGQ
jgi:hypothetical protein